jgi:L-arabinokinase
VVIVVYVSGHGFGHASRDIEVINEIGRLRPDVRLLVRSAVAPWFLNASIRVAAEIQACDTDTGVAQIDSLRLDEDETARRAARFYASFDERAGAEAEVLRSLGASLVVGDIPPLAFAAAHRAGVPSIALGNFTWDWIYAGYPQFERLAPGVIDRIAAAYATATRALRLPLHGGFGSMRAIEDIPFIARTSALGRTGARRALGLPAAATVVLASFGGYGLDLDYRAIAAAGRFTLVVTDHELAPARSPDASGLVRVTTEDLAARGLRYEDVVAAADVVVTKPGYGIVSECIANGASLLYTSRGRFREHDLFVEEMPALVRCRAIAQDELLAGRWDADIDALLGQPAPGVRPRVDGAAVAAAAILRAC